MADNIKVDPNPIQRNAHDVAIELLKIHLDNTAINSSKYSIENLQDAYSKFYVTARALERINPKDLSEFVPKEIKKVFDRY